MVGQLGAKDMLAMFRVCHATRLHVLSHAHSIKLSPGPGARRHVLASLLHIPPDQLRCPALHLCMGKGQDAVPLLHQVLLDGRLQELRLQVSSCLWASSALFLHDKRHLILLGRPSRHRSKARDKEG